MDSFNRLVERHLRVLFDVLGDVSVPECAGVIPSLKHDEVVAVIAETTGVIREMEALRTVAAGVAAQLSTREAGQGGLAQRLGHRTAVSLVQEITGVSRTQAGRVTRLGQTLLETSAPPVPEDAGGVLVPPQVMHGHDISAESATRPWHACLADAFTAGRISLDQQTAIRAGLGDPPPAPEYSDDAHDLRTDADEGAWAAAAATTEWTAAWAAAAEQLVDEASRRTVEDLAAAARMIRDHLDPEGAARRFHDRFDRRSFRMWTDSDGVRHGSFVFEDAGAAWVTAIIDAALRPRRGGPRFVDPAEKTAADRLIADQRSNEQLTYDLVIDTLHTGALADAATVFGTRQAGIRVVVTDGARETTRTGRAAVAILENTNTAVPGAFAGQHACDSGTTTCTVDLAGNPLDLGREARLFSPKQRLALSIRDGGCVWPGCDRPSSYCEAHHIDPYSQGGRTDVHRGVLLCRFHHMNLHHHGWWITRDGTGAFVLHSPAVGTTPIVLEPRLERRYAWGDLRPPPGKFRPAA